MKKNSILFRDFQRIIKWNIKSLLWVSLIFGFLFYLFSMFWSIWFSFQNISQTITDKVWIYFYIQDDINSESTYNRIIDIKDKLAQQGIESNFSSKSDAFSFLENKVPEITRNFDKFGIENPLPSTLYVMFNNKKEYNIMKNIIVTNKDIILNIKDIDKWATLQQQENRSLRILETVSLIWYSIYFIIAILTIIIIVFTQHLLKNFFYEYYKEIEIKKLLWAKHNDVNGWFILTLISVITLWIIIGFILSCWSLNVLTNKLHIIWVDIKFCNAIFYLIWTYILFIWFSIWLGYIELNKLEKKL